MYFDLQVLVKSGCLHRLICTKVYMSLFSDIDSHMCDGVYVFGIYVHSGTML